MKPTPESYVPSHPKLFEVHFVPGEYRSYLKSLSAFKQGEFITPLTGLTRSAKAYTSVQCGPGPDDNVELNSDLVYANHSCEPSIAFDLSSDDSTKWHARAIKNINVGDPLTFFYPSTEWDMTQPFDCECGAKTCLGVVQGAAHLSTDGLNARGFINSWIKDLAAERDMGVAAKKAVTRDPKGLSCPVCGYGFSAREDSDRCGCKRDLF